MTRFQRIDQEPADQRKRGRECGRCGGSAAEEAAKFAFRDEIAHPGVPGATGDGGHRLIQRDRHDERDDAGCRPKERRGGGGDQNERPMPAAQVAMARRLRRRSTSTTAGSCRNCTANGTAASRPIASIAGAESHRVADKEDAGCERAHGFAGERVVEDQPECPVRSIRRSITDGSPLVIFVTSLHMCPARDNCTATLRKPPPQLGDVGERSVPSRRLVQVCSSRCWAYVTSTASRSQARHI